MSKLFKLVDTAEFIGSPLAKKLFPIIRPVVDRLLGFHWMNLTYQEFKDKGAKDPASFLNVGLECFNVQPKIDPALKQALSNIDGPTIVLMNHPYGCIDSFALMQLLENEVGHKWKFLANKILRRIKEFEDKTIMVDPFAKGEAKRENIKSIKEIHKHLKAGNVLGMFPARRVSALNSEINQICDLEWTSHPLKLAKQHNATIILVHCDGQNSDQFLAIPTDQLTKRSLRLAKELPLQKNKSLTLTLSQVMNPELATKIEKFSNKEEVLRAHDYIGADKTTIKPSPQAKQSASTTQSNNAPNLTFINELHGVNPPLIEQGEFISFLFQGHQAPKTLEEIGKLREITFSLIGAGSGNAIDLSEEDQYYHHIVVLHQTTGEVVGAYRIGFSHEIIEEKGLEKLYLNHIFDINPAFYDKIGRAMELSRSFITPVFQKNPAILALLWTSLGKVTQQKNINTVYGSVTVSADYSPLSQAIILDTLARFHAEQEDICSLVSNTNPFTPATKYHQLIADAYEPHGINRLNAVIEDIEENQRSIPPLIRYYITLGAKFLSFKVEPSFGNAIYCLLTVNLDDMPKRHKKRFLGITE